MGRSLLILQYAVGSAAASMVVGGVLILLSGHDPIAAYAALVSGAFGTEANLAATLNLASPLLASAVGAAIAFRAGVFNIGQEGQIAVGGAVVSLLALQVQGYASLPAPQAIGLAILAAVATGALWSSLTTLVRLVSGANEIIISLLFSIIGSLITSYVVSGPLFLEGAGFPESATLPSNVWLPSFPGVGDLHIGILLAVATAMLGWFFLMHTARGFELRSLGAGVEAARYAGIRIGARFALAMAVSGGLAGLAGGIEVLGSQHKLILGFSTGFGFTSLSAALLASLHPLVAIPTSVFFAFLMLGGLHMEQEAGVSSALGFIVQGLTILFLISGLALAEYRRRHHRLPVTEDVATG